MRRKWLWGFVYFRTLIGKELLLVLFTACTFQKVSFYSDPYVMGQNLGAFSINSFQNKMESDS